jgi:hypothetical protein
VFLLLGDLPARQVTNLGGGRITVIATLLDLACEGYRLHPYGYTTRSLVMMPQMLMQ